MRGRGIAIDGCLTGAMRRRGMSVDDAKADETENSRTNAWNIRNDGNTNNNNGKYNRNNAPAVTATIAFREFREGVLQAYADCLRGKRTSPQAVEYQQRAVEDIERLAHEMHAMTWRPAVSKCFVVNFPKPREVFAADFRDRIVHHWVVMRLLPLFEKRCERLGNVSHACRKGYGTKTAIEAAERAMERVSENYTKEAWVLKGDIVGFFMNIDKDILLRQLMVLIESEYHAEDKEWLKVFTEQCVTHRPEKDCVIASPLHYWDAVPSGKSFFYSDGSKGQGIGNLTAQHFAGYYMSFFDEYVAKLFEGEVYGYVRNVDDFVIVHRDKALIKRAARLLNAFLRDELRLRTHEESVYLQPASHGVKFLGQWIKPRRRYVIRRTIGRFRAAYGRCFADCKKGKLLSMDCARHRAVLNSYLGTLRGARTYRVRRELRERAPPEFWRYFTIVRDERVDIKSKYKPCF